MTKEELLELLRDEDVRRAIVDIVTSDSVSRAALLRQDDRRRQAEATGGIGEGRG